MDHAAEPVTIVTAADQALAVNAEGENHCCGVPPTASTQVKATRMASVMIIVIHVIALFFGTIFWGQWVASLIAIVMGSIVLCHFNKYAYNAAAFLFLVAITFDVLSCYFWIMFAENSTDDGTDDDISEDETERTTKLFLISPAIGAVCLFLGAIAAFTATCTWEKSGAPDAVITVECRYPARLPTAPSVA